MDEMVAALQSGEHDIAYHLRIVGYLDAECILDGAHRCQAVHGRAHSAHTHHESPHIARVAVFHYYLYTAHHSAGGICLGYHAVAHHGLHAQMTLDSGHGIYNYFNFHLPRCF